MLPVLLVHDLGDVGKRAPVSPTPQSNKPHSSGVTGKTAMRPPCRGRQIGLYPEELRLMDAKVFVRNDETASSNALPSRWRLMPMNVSPRKA